MNFDYLAHVFVYIAGAIGIISIIVIYLWLIKKDTGTEKMQELASFIRIGANAFLKREFLTITPFLVGLAVILYFVMPDGNWQIALGILVGGGLSMLSIYIGMQASIRANIRTTQAARTSIGKALKIAFRGGSIMGLSIVTFNMLGVLLLMLIFGITPENHESIHMLIGFGFGASLAALFAQLGGGIYTKAADIGADLAGKIEAGIPEDDPRNAAVIADLVGDNVGDCAGRGADLFESGADNVVTTMIVAASPFFVAKYGWTGIMFPVIVRGIGILATLVGIMVVQGNEKKSPLWSVNSGYITTALTCIVFFFFLSLYVMDDMNLFYAQLMGIGGAFSIVFVVQYYTGAKSKAVKNIARHAQSGPALGILEGLAYGMESTVWGTFLLGFVVMGAFALGKGSVDGIYYIAAATMGVKELKGIIMAGDAFGPIVDNAAGISQMAGLGDETRKVGDELDTVGNVTKALAKGYAMGAATMSSMVILFAYLLEYARLSGISFDSLDDILINLIVPVNAVAIFFGAAMPYLFSSLTLRAVNEGVFKVIDEIRRQFKIPGVMEGTTLPEYAHVVDITTQNALKSMVGPTMVTIIVPLIVGFLFGPLPLAVYLISVTASSATLAGTQFNSGGALDNAKKIVEEGLYGGKGTKTHAAVVIGDTFGDPLKDTAGPSLHILVKLQNIMSITLLPLFIRFGLNLFQ